MIMKYIISEVKGRGSIVSGGLRFDFNGEDGGVDLPVLRPSGVQWSGVDRQVSNPLAFG